MPPARRLYGRRALFYVKDQPNPAFRRDSDWVIVLAGEADRTATLIKRDGKVFQYFHSDQASTFCSRYPTDDRINHYMSAESQVAS